MNDNLINEIIEQVKLYTKEMDDINDLIENRTIDLSEFMVVDNMDFVKMLYEELLLRDYDIQGLITHVRNLNNNVTTRWHLINSFQNSDEGQEARILVTGITKKYILINKIKRKLYNIFGIRYIIKLIMGLVRIPKLYHKISELELELTITKFDLKQKSKL